MIIAIERGTYIRIEDMKVKTIPVKDIAPVLYGPESLPLGKLAMIEDPNGVKVAVLQLNE